MKAEIKAHDLMVGNWLSKYGEQYQITSATIVGLERGDSEVEPIPLTEEWLVRFGFNNKYTKGKFTIIPKGKLNYENGRTYFNSWTILEHQPEYVHQLQNLYYTLTNEHLTIK